MDRFDFWLFSGVKNFDCSMGTYDGFISISYIAEPPRERRGRPYEYYARRREPRTVFRIGMV